MSLALRRFTYLSFFLLFFILAPLLIFYSLGYRYNFNSNLIEKNGAFFIKSYPRNSNISIDQKKSKYKTPAQITNVKPGEHFIEISKEGFINWHKKLNVKTGETTFIEDVALFLTEQKKVALGPGALNYLVNKNQDKYAYLENQTLWRVNTEQANVAATYTFDQDTNLIDWSPDDQKMLILQKQYKIFDLNQQKIETLSLPKLDKIKWDNQDPYVLWYLSDQTLWRYNIALNKASKKIDNIVDFDLTGQYIIVQTDEKTNGHVQQLHKEQDIVVRELKNLPLGKIRALLADDDYLIVSLGSRLYLQRPKEELMIIPATLVEIYGKFLLINDGYQTILYDYNDNYKEIIDRSSQIVSEVKWHPNGSYFLSETNNLTHIYELDGRDYRNNVKVLEDPLKKMYLFNKKGDRLFILTEEENFYIEIQ